MDNLFLFEYNIESLSRAIYCITSWFPNRRFLGIVDQLNRDFISNETKILGTEKIDTYIKFIEFYTKVIETYIPEFPPEDYPIDIGNVRFYSNNRFHKVFIGNGSEDTYETTFIIESLVHEFEQFKEIWHEILNYEDSVISILERSRNEFTKDEFQCPPETYFNLIVEHYDRFRNDRLAQYFENFTSENDELYPFFTSENKLPVFLPLMKESFIEKIEDETDKVSFNQSIWLSFWRRLNCNFTSFFEREGNSFFNLRLIHRVTKEKINLENTLAFLHEDKLIILEQNNKQIPNYLKEGIIENHYQIAGLNQDGEVRCFEFKAKGNVVFVGVGVDEVSPNRSKIFLFEEDDDHVINASALIGIINNADSIKEIVDFFVVYDTSQDGIMSFANEDAMFRLWKKSNYIVNEGSFPLTVVLFAYETVRYNVELFDKISLNYPFEIPEQFHNVHSWEIVDKEQTDLSLISKSHRRSVDIFSDGKKKIIYQESHSIIEDLSIHDYEMIKSFNEIVLNSLERNKDIILCDCETDLVEIHLVSKSVLEESSVYSHLIQELKYFKKLPFSKTANHQINLLAPKWDKIFQDNLSEHTLKFENTILLNLLEGIIFKNRSLLFEKIKQTDGDKRTSGVFEISVRYFVDPLLEFKVPEISSFKKVRKSIAKIIKELDLETGVYCEQDIVGIVKCFRNSLRNDLASIISLYNQEDLNLKLQNCLASIVLNVDIHKKRLATFTEMGNLQSDKLEKFRQQTIKSREEARVYRPILEYLIEENLIIDRDGSVRPPTDDIVNELIAYGKYILDFQLISDAYSYGASNWFQLEIEDNYVVNISETEKYLKFVDEMTKVKYEYGDYIIRNEEIDRNMMEMVKYSFLQDTKIDFDSFIDFLLLFSNNGCILELKNRKLLNIYGNVVKGKLVDLAKYFADNSGYSIEIFYCILKFLVLDKNKVTYNGVIPIWEKKKRDNKVSSKPVIVSQDNIVFSPILFDRLKKDWVEGFMNFILPYDIGMQNTLNIINHWKKVYEQQIVREVRNLFKTNRYRTYIDQELYKLDVKGKHPRDLGDYDLIVIDTQLREILLFEVKYMRLSQTMKDSMGDQKEYFSGKKAKALKYKRRIEYFGKNLDKICQNLGLEGKFTMKSYFLTNKIIRSNFANFPFDIVSYNELKALRNS
ncbi:TPA: hypothetical protein ACGO1J_002129 [Streptococcus suis]